MYHARPQMEAIFYLLRHWIPPTPTQIKRLTRLDVFGSFVPLTLIRFEKRLPFFRLAAPSASGVIHIIASGLASRHNWIRTILTAGLASNDVHKYILSIPVPLKYPTYFRRIFSTPLCKLLIMKVEYNNLFTHFILITANRFPYIEENIRIRIEKYITGVVKNNQSRLYAIYANPEHVHLLVSRSPKISEESLISVIARSTSSFINDNKLCKHNFEWQDSSAAFSVSKSDVDKVCKYILNQPEHHKKITFQQEYESLLKFYQSRLQWERWETPGISEPPILLVGQLYRTRRGQAKSFKRGTFWQIPKKNLQYTLSTSIAISKLKTDCGTDYKVDKVGCFWFICVTKDDKVWKLIALSSGCAQKKDFQKHYPTNSWQTAKSTHLKRNVRQEIRPAMNQIEWKIIKLEYRQVLYFQRNRQFNNVSITHG